MAIHQQQQQHSTSSLLDDLYCEEERWEDEDEDVFQEQSDNNVDHLVKVTSSSLTPLLLLDQDLFWEDEELVSLFSKEQQQKNNTNLCFDQYESEYSLLVAARCEAVEWMLKVGAHYGFTTLTSMLAINYLDRFLSSVHFESDKPWMIQLVAVTCISLAAKVEETHVPLLLDLQVEDTKYLFEAKTIQKMELLLLSTLNWKMHPVTPLSFLDHITRRLGLKSQYHWEFFKLCERLLLSVVADSRFAGYLPSVLATATMLSVIDNFEPHNATEYQDQLLGIFKMDRDKASDCYQLILDLGKALFNDTSYNYNNGHKRKYEQISGSPYSVIHVSFSCIGTNNDSGAVGSCVYSSPEPLMKKSRIQQNQMSLASLSRVFVDIVRSSPS